MTGVDDLLRALLKICPNGELTEDATGQLVFYTGLAESVPHGYITEWDPEEGDEQ